MDEFQNDIRDRATALGIVVATAVVAWTSGIAPTTAPMIFLGAIALGAWIGGAVAGIIALFASMLMIDLLFTTSTITTAGPWSAFAVVGSLIAWLIARHRERLRATVSELNATRSRACMLETSERDARVLNSAYDQLSSLSGGSAAIVLNRRGLIMSWTDGARRMYGRRGGEMLGVGAQALFDVAEASELQDIMRDALAAGKARWSGVHRRHDGTPFDVDVEVRPVEGVDAFTLVVRDLTRDRQWEAFRAAAVRSDAALREEAELMRGQLAALESVTDPTLDVSRRDDIEQLLERLRQAVDADGVAFLQPGGVRKRLVTAQGLQPTTSAPRVLAETRRPANRVLLVQNDPDRVSQSSVLAWPETVSCLVAIAISAAGQPRGILEVVNERPRRATDADMALIRVVANRIAAFGGEGYDAQAGAVA